MYMARRAAAVVGNDESAQREYILANADQDDEFWDATVADGKKPGKAAKAPSVGGGAADGENYDLPPPPPPSLARIRSRTSSVPHAPNSAASSAPGSNGPTADWTVALRVQPAFALLQAASSSPSAAEEEDGAWLPTVATGDLVDVNVTACATHFSGHDLQPIQGAENNVRCHHRGRGGGLWANA
jgi:hypothetical protein